MSWVTCVMRCQSARRKTFSPILKLVQCLKEVAESHASTPGQAVLAWLLGQRPDVIPIPGSKSTAQMDENAASALLRLSDQEVWAARNLRAQIEIKGTQYHTIKLIVFCLPDCALGYVNRSNSTMEVFYKDTPPSERADVKNR
ncbi:hypothetical protein N7461_002364 [Penicillium sp. DV-2018c]|nr:hypothetical protein N7461_002364 [Penicillium sp. DV-2018c]